MNRRRLIEQMTPGDVFHATYPNGSTRIYVVTTQEPAALFARSITTGETSRFDHASGESSPSEADGAPCKIDSLALLPPDIRSHIEEIDRRYRASDDVGRLQLSKEEQRALLDAGAFFAANPLPDGQA